MVGHRLELYAEPLASPRSVDRLAELAGMSRSAFTNRFAQVFGESAIDFLTKVRLRLAAHLLTTTDLPVKLVAKSIGYSSRSYFSRAFRAAYGQDPASFRSFRYVSTGRALGAETAPSLAPE